MRLFLSLAFFLLFATGVFAGRNDPLPEPLPFPASTRVVSIVSVDKAARPSSPRPDESGAKTGNGASPAGSDQSDADPPSQPVEASPLLGRQPQRILGIMPNYRAVSAGEIPPPPTPKQAFWIATKNNFDYSSFVFVGLTSMMAEGADSHPQLGKGVPGFGRYYWRGFMDKTDGNYLVIFALPTVFHQDERYFAKGQGGIWKRAFYAASRVAITPSYEGRGTLNVSELLGRGIAQGISTAYYPSQTRTLGGIASKYGFAILRDASTNTFREFWPDIATHVLHRHP